jgi:hypothetical protein
VKPSVPAYPSFSTVVLHVSGPYFPGYIPAPQSQPLRRCEISRSLSGGDPHSLVRKRFAINLSDRYTNWHYVQGGVVAYSERVHEGSPPFRLRRNASRQLFLCCLWCRGTNVNDCSGDERVGRIHDDFIGRSHALHDLDGGAEVATYFDIAEFDTFIGFHNSDL